MPELFNVRRSGDRHTPPSAVNIMRPGKWGNPFPVTADVSQEQAVFMHALLVFNTPGMVDEIRQELAGRDMVCCCAPKPCHGHTLMAVANATPEELRQLRQQYQLPRDTINVVTQMRALFSDLKSAKSISGVSKEGFTDALRSSMITTMSLLSVYHQMGRRTVDQFVKKHRQLRAEATAWANALAGLDVRYERVVEEGLDDMPEVAVCHLSMPETDFYTLLRRLAVDPEQVTKPQGKPHPDDEAVDRFAAAMKAKLAAAREKGRAGWDDPEMCSELYLAKLLVGQTFRGNAGSLEDVANFAMMLHQRGADPEVLAEAARLAVMDIREQMLRS